MAFTGLASEVAKYNPENIIYLELDKDYYQIARDLNFFLPQEVKVFFRDARSFFRSKQRKFDVVIINYSNPSTLAENRYFTKEFFSLINSCLNKEAVVAIKLDVTPNYNVGAQNKMLAIFYWTLKDVFEHVYSLPDNEVLFLASSQEIEFNFERISQKYRELDLDNKFVTPNLIKWRQENDRVEKLRKDT